jgi:hypothetical protein
MAGVSSRPMSVTHHVVVTFDRNNEGDRTPGAVQEATDLHSGERSARMLALKHVGEVASSCTGDPRRRISERGAPGQFGEVDLAALSE